MGYTTEFTGEFVVDRPVEEDLLLYIQNFCEVRHMKYDVEKIKADFPNWEDFCYRGDLGREGEYFVGEVSVFKSPDRKYYKRFSQRDLHLFYDKYAIDQNNPPTGVPGLWCQWEIPDDKRDVIRWNGTEKFYHYGNWLHYLIEHFLAPNGYKVNGLVMFRGEFIDDVGFIFVNDNKIHIEKISLDKGAE